MTNDINKTGEFLNALTRLSLAEEKVAALSQDVANWKLEADISVKKNDMGFWVVANFQKPSGKGFTQLISPEDALYYSADPETLVESLTQKIFEQLYHQSIRDQITTEVSKAIKNAASLAANRA